MAITPINSFDLPVNNADFDTWGTKLNTVFDAIDTLLGSPANTIKGNNTGSLAPTANLTTAQVAAMLPAFVGDSGAGGTRGSVPAPAAGDAAAGKVLGASGGWVSGAFNKAGRFVGSTGATVISRGVTVSRASVGQYNVTISPAMPDAGYTPQIVLETGFPNCALPAITTKTTTGFVLFTQRDPPGGGGTGGVPYDPDFFTVLVVTI